MVQNNFKTLSDHIDPHSLLMSKCHNSYCEGRHFLYLFLLLRVTRLGSILLQFNFSSLCLGHAKLKLQQSGMGHKGQLGT